MPAGGQGSKFSTSTTIWYSLCSVISRVNILTAKATRNYSYMDLPGRLAFFTMVSIRDVVRGQNSLICKFFSVHIRNKNLLEIICTWTIANGYN